MGDLYIFASGQVFGLTPCAPVVRHDKNTKEVKFESALCIDLNISGSLSNYFSFILDAKEQNAYMLFNEIEGEDYRDASVNDENSQFIKFLKQVTEEQIKEHNREFPLDQWTDFKYTDIEFERMTARLFKDKIIEWGVLYVTYFKKNGGETSREQWFAIEVMNVDYRSMKFQNFDLRAYESLEEAS